MIGLGLSLIVTLLAVCEPVKASLKSPAFAQHAGEVRAVAGGWVTPNADSTLTWCRCPPQRVLKQEQP